LHHEGNWEEVVIQSNEIVSPERRFPEASLLLHEFSHRINNEFASIIATLSTACARTTNDETRAVLNIVQDQLYSYARVHHALKMPERSIQIDAADYLRKLCRAIARSKLHAQGITLIFVDHPLRMESERCWRLGLIVSELITNAARHAFRHSGGTIRVEISQPSFSVQCLVTDNGGGRAVGQPGHGAAIIRALADSLGGRFDQHFGVNGTTAILIFPSDPLEEIGVASVEGWKGKKLST
jgi:two-component sensor histidine kinase